MAAPLNNQNALTNGTRRSLEAARRGFRARRLPKGFKYVAEETSVYAGGLYDDAESVHGTVDREQMEIIEAAAAWQQHALYVLRVLRVDHDLLKPETRVQLSAEVAKASQRRADLVKQLRLSDEKPHGEGKWWDGTLPPGPGPSNTTENINEIATSQQAVAGNVLNPATLLAGQENHGDSDAAGE